MVGIVHILLMTIDVIIISKFLFNCVNICIKYNALEIVKNTSNVLDEYKSHLNIIVKV